MKSCLNQELRTLPISILIDNSILSYGLVAHGVKVDSNGPFSNKLLLIQAKPARTKHEKWLQDQIECLPTISRLSNEGKLKLLTYDELEFEAWRNPSSYPHFSIGDIFARCTIESVQSALRRSIFPFWNPLKEKSSEGLCSFVAFIIEGAARAWLINPLVRESITRFEVDSLNDISGIKKTCRILSEKQYGDAFHLWTGERNEIPFFLTIDKKLINVATAQGRNRLKCHPISPSSLLDFLDITSRDLLLFSYGQRYFLNGTPYSS